MGSIPLPLPDPSTQSTFDDFQRQTSLMTSCTLLWKELSDHFTSLEQTLINKSDAIKQKIQSLEAETNASLLSLQHRESTLDHSLSISLQHIQSAVNSAVNSTVNYNSTVNPAVNFAVNSAVNYNSAVNSAVTYNSTVNSAVNYNSTVNSAVNSAVNSISAVNSTVNSAVNSISAVNSTVNFNSAVNSAVNSNSAVSCNSTVNSSVKSADGTGNGNGNGNGDGELDDTEGLLMKMKAYCVEMDAYGFGKLVYGKKKEVEAIRDRVPFALAECVDPATFVMEAISEVFPVDRREVCMNDLSSVCVLMLESLVPVLVDPVIGAERVLVTPSVRKRAREVAEKWKERVEEEGGNVKPVDVHTFFQHLLTFGIVDGADVGLYRKLVVGSAWRKQMPKLGVSLGLGDQMPDMIEELIRKGQQVDAVHFIHEVGLVDRFPPVSLLKSFLKDAKTAATSILEDSKNCSRSVHLAARKEQSALKAVIKCIEEYKLEDEFPPENLKKRLQQLEKVKMEKKRPAAVGPANKRIRASNVGSMPPAKKAGRITNAYVSSFPPPPTFVRSPSHTQYPSGYPVSPPMYVHGNMSPPTNPYATPYSPEPHLSPPLSYPGTPPMNYPSIYGGYVNGMQPAYQQAYYR